tara:strand:- start:14727 stop:14906 length:180 start_codon:yes stop_codon:yes gene_type:complete
MIYKIEYKYENSDEEIKENVFYVKEEEIRLINYDYEHEPHKFTYGDNPTHYVLKSIKSV